jgi:hypothetical protein
MTTTCPVAQRTVSPVRVPAWRRIFSFPAMLAGLLMVLGVLAVRSRFDDPDMWWHLSTGRFIWSTHTIPLGELFSYATDRHLRIPHEWLSQVLIYSAYRLGGYSGLMFWLCFFTVALLIAGYVLCWLYSGNAKVGFLGALIICLFATSGLSIRPQLIGYLLLIVELLLLHLGHTRNAKLFFWLPPLFALWVNCHGSFFLGLGIGAAVLLCSFARFRMGPFVPSLWEPRTRLMLALALTLSVAALWLNPVGTKQVFYPLNLMMHQPINLNQVQEWVPLQLNDGRGLGFLAVLGCLSLVMILRRSEMFWDELLLVLLGVGLAANHRRMVFVFGILAAPILSRLLAPLWDSYHAEEDRALPNAVLIGASLLIAFWSFPGLKNLTGQVDRENPVKAVEFMKAHHLSGRMLNDYVYGGYLTWGAPEHPVFLFGGADIIDWNGVVDEFGRWATLQSDPNALPDKYKIDFCLLAQQSPMTRVLPLIGKWKIIYSDDRSVIFTRAAPR